MKLPIQSAPVQRGTGILQMSQRDRAHNSVQPMMWDDAKRKWQCPWAYFECFCHKDDPNWKACQDYTANQCWEFVDSSRCT